MSLVLVYSTAIIVLAYVDGTGIARLCLEPGRTLWTLVLMYQAQAPSMSHLECALHPRNTSPCVRSLRRHSAAPSPARDEGTEVHLTLYAVVYCSIVGPGSGDSVTDGGCWLTYPGLVTQLPA